MVAIDSQAAPSESVLAQLFARRHRHAIRYGDVLYGGALVRHGDVWRCATAFFAPLQKGAVQSDLRVDYGDLLIVRGHLPLESAKALLTELVESSRLSLPGTPDVSIRASLQHYGSRHGSHGSRARRFPIEFAAYEYPFQMQNGADARPASGYVCGLGVPLYPHAFAAIQDLLSL
jgi:hypothetical protein